MRVLFGVLLLGPLMRRTTGKKVRLLAVPQDGEVLLAVTELCAEGQIVPSIDRIYPLREAREAIRYVSQGRQKGKVVITCED
jgi:NADPH:quinone reductase-like Zn-dependent oxidoreductase